MIEILLYFIKKMNTLKYYVCDQISIILNYRLNDKYNFNHPKIIICIYNLSKLIKYKKKEK